MKDRTTKSMTNVWTKINKDIAELDDLDDGTGSAITTPKKGNGKIISILTLGFEFSQTDCWFQKQLQRESQLHRGMTATKNPKLHLGRKVHYAILALETLRYHFYFNTATQVELLL